MKIDYRFFDTYDEAIAFQRRAATKAEDTALWACMLTRVHAQMPPAPNGGEWAPHCTNRVLVTARRNADGHWGWCYMSAETKGIVSDYLMDDRDDLKNTWIYVVLVKKEEK